MTIVECLLLRNFSKNFPEWALSGGSLEPSEVDALRHVVVSTLNHMVDQRLIGNFQIRLVDAKGVHLMIQDAYARHQCTEFSYSLDSLRELCLVAEVMLS